MQVTTDTMVLFWMPDSIFSNFYPKAPLTLPDYPDIHFSNSEAAFMFMKAQTFGDGVASVMIVNSQNPKECKRIGRTINSFDEDHWAEVRYQIMYDVVYAKFSQNAKLMKGLLATGDRILVEASPYDKVWGIGLRPEDPRARDCSNWDGLNLLGKVLMEVRDTLRQELIAMKDSLYNDIKP